MRRRELPTSNPRLPGTPRPFWGLGVAGRALIAAAVLTVACGKKGPPLTPIVFVPAEAPASAPRRLGNDIYLTITVPAQNIDASKPAAISRVDVYAATSLEPPPRNRFIEIARRVATIPVAPALLPGEPAPATPATGAVQGTPVLVRDTLAAEDLVPRALKPLPGARTPAIAVAPVAQLLRRFYMTVPYSLRGIPGPPSAILEVPLSPLPEPPSDLRLASTETSVTLTWAPSGGLIGWLLDTVAKTVEPAPLDNLPPAASRPPLLETPAGPATYRVYRERAADPLELPDAAASAAPWQAVLPVAAAPAAVAALTFTEPIVFDERQVCYTVRTVRGAVEGNASDPVCVTPVDVFPPAPPSGLSVVAAEGQITLVWQPNSEADLGGYIVLRREAGSATLLPLMESPIGDARYVDRQVKTGVEYVYAVVAVDDRVPLPNMSLPSAEASDTAR